MHRVDPPHEVSLNKKNTTFTFPYREQTGTLIPFSSFAQVKSFTVGVAWGLS